MSQENVRTMEQQATVRTLGQELDLWNTQFGRVAGEEQCNLVDIKVQIRKGTLGETIMANLGFLAFCKLLQSALPQAPSSTDTRLLSNWVLQHCMRYTSLHLGEAMGWVGLCSVK